MAYQASIWLELGMKVQIYFYITTYFHFFMNQMNQKLFFLKNSDIITHLNFWKIFTVIKSPQGENCVSLSVLGSNKLIIMQTNYFGFFLRYVRSTTFCQGRSVDDELCVRIFILGKNL